MDDDDFRNPEWLHKHPNEWPTSARTFYSLMGQIALRRMDKMRKQNALNDRESPEKDS